MYNNLSNGLKNEINSILKDRNKKRLLLLGFGCSYVYTTGCILYSKVANRKSEDSDRIEGLVHHFYITNVSTHLSPYMLPIFIKKGCMLNIDRVLRTEKSDLRERMYAYSALMRIGNTPSAIKYLANQHPSGWVELESYLSPNLRPFSLLIENFLKPKKLNYKTTVKSSDGSIIFKEGDETENMFHFKAKAMENLLKNVDAKDRELSYEQIKDLVKLSSKYKTVRSKEMISKVLLLLLQNERNVEKVLKNEHEHFNLFPVIKSDQQSVQTNQNLCPVLTYLYSHKFKNKRITNVLTEEYTLILYNSDCVKEINKSLKKSFNTLPPLYVPLNNEFLKKHKNGLNSFFTIFEVSYIYAILRHLSDKKSGPSRFAGLKNSWKSGWQTFRGLLLFELFYSGQEKLINSDFYFNHDKFVYPLSFAMFMSTYLGLSFVCMTQRFFFGPMLMTRFLL